MDIDFYQHLILATWLFILLYRWLYKQLTMILVLAIGLMWEMAEYFYNMDAYSGFKHYFLDSLFDMAAALIAFLVCIFILKDKK